MADAYFRVTGDPIPVYVSTGPGPMNLTIALANAFYDSSAFLAITGQVTDPSGAAVPKAMVPAQPPLPTA